MFGIVLRVQQILHFFPASFTNLFVYVAIPEISDKKFNATLSAIKIFQSIPLVLSGASEFYNLTDKQIALSSSSHFGEPKHIITSHFISSAGLKSAWLHNISASFL